MCYSTIKGNELIELAAKQASTMHLTRQAFAARKNFCANTSNRLYYLSEIGGVEFLLR